MDNTVTNPAVGKAPLNSGAVTPAAASQQAVPASPAKETHAHGDESPKGGETKVDESHVSGASVNAAKPATVKQ